MKIINKLTLRYLKENKKRTIFTILSIALSITMINAVGISLNSIMNYYRETIEKRDGVFHYTFITKDQNVFQTIENDQQIKEYYYTNTIEYVDQKTKENLSLKRGDKTFYEKKNLEQFLIEGKLPTNSKEIVLSESYIENAKIGDFITLYKEEKPVEFKVVGFMDGYETSSRIESSFDLLSYVDLNNGEYYTITITDQDVSKNIFTHSKEIYNKYKNEIIGFHYNSSYLGSMGIFEDGSTSSFMIVYRLVAVILTIIIIASVIIIYQAFHLSMNDKIQYLGLLSSVGTTPKQKRNSVFFEGMFLTFIALPIGFICSYLGMFITFTYMNSLDIIKETGALLKVSLSLKYTLLTIILGIMTVFISLIVPAMKLSRISVIDALKKSDDIKVKKSKLKVGFISRKLLRYDQQLAIKNYKRQGKRSKVIIISLVLSMVLFITMYSFTNQMYKSIINNNSYDLYDLTEIISENQEELDKFKKILNDNDKVDSYYYHTSIYDARVQLNQDDFSQQLYNDGYMNLYIYALDEQSFEKLCKDNDVKYIGEKQALIKGMSILINQEKNEYQVIYNEDADKNLFKKVEFTKLENDEENYAEAPLFNRIDYIQNDTYKMFNNYGASIEIIVPISYVENLDDGKDTGIKFCIQSDQHVSLCEDLKELGYYPYDQSESNQSQIQTLLIIQIFVYGFIALMILFSLLNIVNMMSASIDKRKKEFAMMLSVGMSPTGIKKMIFYESLIYGLKTFLYGLPICILIEWTMYKMGSSYELFQISYTAYIVSFVVIMVVMIMTFKAGLKKLNKQNIIESLKDDM